MQATMKAAEVNQSVMKMQTVNLEGNIIPHKWFSAIKTKSGNPDFPAIVVLSEIVYWYRPSQKFDEIGRIIGLKQKFRGDLLQKSYEDLSQKLGITKRQAREAVIRLEKIGVIEREFRNIVVRGTPLSNVLFIHLHVEKLKEITYL